MVVCSKTKNALKKHDIWKTDELKEILNADDAETTDEIIEKMFSVIHRKLLKIGKQLPETKISQYSQKKKKKKKNSIHSDLVRKNQV